VTDAAGAAYEAGLKALSRRELSRAELMGRLERSGVDPEDAAKASSRLAEAGYQSDERTASERARVLASRLYGDVAIRVDLTRRGISEADIESALDGIAPELERAERLARRTREDARLGRALHRKGFTEDTIAASLRIPGMQE
jgi:regulatory protein